jgi:hypothetical protein
LMFDTKIHPFIVPRVFVRPLFSHPSTEHFIDVLIGVDS